MLRIASGRGLRAFQSEKVEDWIVHVLRFAEFCLPQSARLRCWVGWAARSQSKGWRWGSIWFHHSTPMRGWSWMVIDWCQTASASLSQAPETKTKTKEEEARQDTDSRERALNHVTQINRWQVTATKKKAEDEASSRKSKCFGIRWQIHVCFSGILLKMLTICLVHVYMSPGHVDIYIYMLLYVIWL